MEIFPTLDRSRRLLTKAQKQILLERFQANEYLTNTAKRELAMSLNLTEKQIAKWYYNERRRKAAAEGTSCQNARE